jgi:ABC-type branched-subunit amino acid transport system substrate-binding protein
VRIAMLLPRGAPGNAASVAEELRRGAVMALNEFGQNRIQLVIKDTQGQAAGAQSAASEAVQEGSAAILGPVFAGNVAAASAITLPAGRAMIAFSTDTSVARRGVYLIGFLPQADTARIIDFALSRGIRSILAFLPSNAEGTLREAILRQSAGAVGARVSIVKYDRSAAAIEKAVANAAPLLDSSDAIYIPEGAEIPNVIMQGFRRLDAKAFGKQIIGSGTWESVDFGQAVLEGALYPGRDLANFAGFAQRFEAQNGAKPGVWAALGYDAVTLASNLAQSLGQGQAFRTDVLESPRGYSGVNGIFRFKADGTSERGLAIYQVRGGKGEIVSPAPTTFARSGS